MLLQLSIRNIALIDTLSVAFEPGLNAMTGETGAGKSIVVGSLDFVLGGRADKDRIAGDADRGRVEALFDVSQQPNVLLTLEEMGLEAEGGLLPISREISRSGRSICRVAGSVVPLSRLREITAQLVDLHGQHAHQSLLSAATHLSFLDAMGDAAHKDTVHSVRAMYAQWSAARRALVSEKTDIMERARREDMLRFQLEELDEANLVAGEEEVLEQKRRMMRGAERIREGLAQAHATLLGGFDDEMPSAVDAMRVALSSLSSLSRFGDAYEKVHDQLAEAVYAAEAVAEDIGDLLESVDGDPAELERIEARMDLISRLRRKYGATTEDMLRFAENAREELSRSESTDARIAALEKEEKALHAKLQKAVKALSAARHALSAICQTRVLSELADLGMEEARFEVRFDEDAQLTADGLDKVEFLLSANTGVALQPMSRVASGGELSRIMLAFKCIEAENEGISVLVFDEIDTGISGRMGQVVADKMHQVAGTRQVLCVTHLPQIAASADAQYLVEKQEIDGVTRTHVVELDANGRIDAIARMLGDGDTARAHASAMLREAHHM